MSNAAVTVTYDKSEVYANVTQHSDIKYGTLAIGASPGTYPTGGLSISWIVGDTPKVVNTTPKDVWLYGAAGYYYTWNPSTNKIQIWTGAAAQSPLTELTNGASIPAAVSGDTIRFEARFSKAF